MSPVENVGAPGGGRARHRRDLVVGRDAEIAILTDLADRTVESGAHVVFVSGEAGIGKSTLVRHFLADRADQGWGVHVGQCIEYSERAIPFGAITNMLRSVLRDAGDAAEQILGHLRADLAALLPEWRTDGVDGAPLSGDVDRLIDAISSVLINAAEAGPMALFIEDIHWADGPTRDVVASLVHSLRTSPVLLIVSERTGAVPRGHHVRTWLAEQRRFPNVQTLALTGLTPDALTEQAENILGSTPDPSMIAELAKRTGGNAYFANELLHAQRNGDLSLPTTLADFLTSRLEHLDPEEQRVLQSMAVAGKAIEHRVLAATLPAVDLAAPLRHLFDTSLITVDGSTYDFGHALMREAMLRSVLPFEAEDIHRRIAEAMENDAASGRSLTDLATLAMHWAGANDPTRSLSASVAAARSSAEVAAYDAAAELAIDALRLWSSVPDAEQVTGVTRDDLTVDVSDWLVASDQVDRAGTLLLEAVNSWAADLPDGRKALLLAKLCPIRFHQGDPGAASDFMDRAVELVGDEISRQAAHIHNRVSKLALPNAAIQPAIEAADRAIEIASEVGPERVLCEAMTTKALGLGVTVGKEAGIELVHQSRRRALASNLVSEAAHTFRVESMILSFQDGRTPESLDVLREGVAFANDRCGPGLRLDLLHDLALGLVEDGNLVEADPLLETLLSRPTKTQRYLATSQTKALSALLARDLEQAENMLRSSNTLASKFSDQELGYQLRLEAELARKTGQFDDALRLIDDALELQLAGDNSTFTRESVVEKARLARDLATVDSEQTAAVRDATVELLDDIGPDSQASRTLRSLVRLLLDLSDGDSPADDAAALTQGLAANGFGADAKQTAALWVELLAAERPESPELAGAVTELRELGRSSGMIWLGDVADRFMADEETPIDLTTVVDLTEPADTSPRPDHGLTPREIEVLGFLARGLTNKEIGQELFVSHRTVSTHVSNLLAKLHLKNRSEAASKFHELGFANAER